MILDSLFKKMEQLCGLFQDKPDTTWGYEDDNLQDMNLENIAEVLPVSNENLYLSRIYRLFTMITDNPENRGVLQKVERDVKRRINNAAKILDTYQEMEVPSGAEKTNQAIIEGFSYFYDGLYSFKDFIDTGDSAYVLEAFELIFRGDEILYGVRDELTRNDEQGFSLMIA